MFSTSHFAWTKALHPPTGKGRGEGNEAPGFLTGSDCFRTKPKANEGAKGGGPGVPRRRAGATLGACSLANGLASLGLLCLLLGCATDGLSPASASGITHLYLFSAPVAVTFGGGASADGIALKIFACQRETSKGVPIRTGQLEILMFDGLVEATNAHHLTPLKAWSLAAKDLKRFEFNRTAGVGYDLALGWEQAKPTAVRITVLARYRVSKDRFVESEPTIISTAAR